MYLYIFVLCTIPNITRRSKNNKSVKSQGWVKGSDWRINGITDSAAFGFIHTMYSFI